MLYRLTKLWDIETIALSLWFPGSEISLFGFKRSRRGGSRQQPPLLPPPHFPRGIFQRLLAASLWMLRWRHFHTPFPSTSRGPSWVWWNPSFWILETSEKKSQFLDSEDEIPNPSILMCVIILILGTALRDTSISHCHKTLRYPSPTSFIPEEMGNSQNVLS